MNIVTGYRGFVGSHLFKALPDCIGIGQEDCFDFLENFDFSKIDCMYHIGGISSTTETDVNKLHKYNVEFSIRLFEKCIQYKIPVKYASSASVYGNLYPNINPLNFYSMTKATIDYWVLQNLSSFSKIQGYRFFNVYGEGEQHKGNQSSPVHQFTQQCLRGKPIKVFENSQNFVRDFICVEDVVSVMQLEKPSGIYDLGTSNPISFLRVAELIAQKYSGTIEEIPFPKHLENKYQYYTCAARDFDYDYMSVEEWLKL